VYYVKLCIVYTAVFGGVAGNSEPMGAQDGDMAKTVRRTQEPGELRFCLVFNLK